MRTEKQGKKGLETENVDENFSKAKMLEQKKIWNRKWWLCGEKKFRSQKQLLERILPLKILVRQSSKNSKEFFKEFEENFSKKFAENSF